MKYLILLMIFAACSPVKQVLRDPEKTLIVVDEYLKRYPITSDTAYIHLPGDSLIFVRTNVDTTYIFDSLYIPVERIVTRTVTRNITKVDTVVKTVTNREFERALQQQNIAKDITIAQLEKDVTGVKSDRNKWRLWFWLIVAGVTGIGSLILFKKK